MFKNGDVHGMFSIYFRENSVGLHANSWFNFQDAEIWNGSPSSNSFLMSSDALWNNEGPGVGMAYSTDCPRCSPT